MKFNTLNTIIDDIILTARNSEVAESESLSRIQVEQWVHSYRALLIKQDIDKGRDVNDMYVQRIPFVHLDSVTNDAGYTEYESTIKIPKTIDFHFKSGIVSVTDMYDNLIQLGSFTKAKYQKYRKNTGEDYIAYLKGNHIHVFGDSNSLEYINIDLIAENPAEVGTCFDPNDEYPIPANMVLTLKNMILVNELQLMIRMPSDDTNDSKDDMQHITYIRPTSTKTNTQKNNATN